MVYRKMRKIGTYTQKLQSTYLTLKFYIQTYFISASSLQELPFQSIFPEISTCVLLNAFPSSHIHVDHDRVHHRQCISLDYLSLVTKHSSLSLVCSLILHAMKTSGCSYLAMYQSWWVSCQQPTSNSKLNTQLNTIKFYFSFMGSPGKLY